MGLGDNLLASGMARGALALGKRTAFGNGHTIVWDGYSERIFQHNPNIARPGDEQATDLRWVQHYKGSRLYNTHDHVNDRWVWNYSFKATPGEVFLTKAERAVGKRYGRGFVIIEPNLPRQKSASVNKDWGIPNYQAVASWLKRRGYRVLQFSYGAGKTLSGGVEHVRTTSFRDAMAIMAHASLYIGPEGGLHHAAAADKRNAADGSLIAGGIPAVVMFGGFIPPSVTGYDMHTNLTGGAEACGSLQPCQHCRDAMANISIDEVRAAAEVYLGQAAA